MNELNTATTDELVEELQRRFLAVVIAGHRDEKGTGEFWCVWDGFPSHALGLATRACVRLNQIMDEETAERERSDD